MGPMSEKIEEGDAPPPMAPLALDARGLRCPMPVLRLEAALRRLEPGARVLVMADDPIAVLDIPNACREGGHGVERREDEGGACVFLVTRG